MEDQRRKLVTAAAVFFVAAASIAICDRSASRAYALVELVGGFAGARTIHLQGSSCLPAFPDDVLLEDRDLRFQSIVREPEASPPRRAGDLQALGANGLKATLRTEVMGAPNLSEEGESQVAVLVPIIGVAEAKRLDNKMALEIERILGEQVRPHDTDGPFWWPRRVTIGEVFHKHLLWRHLSLQSFDELAEALILKGLATALANPRVIVRDGQEVRIWIGSQRPVRVESPGGDHAGRTEVKTVDAGVKVCVTPHVGDQNNITISLRVEVTDILPRPGHPDPIVRSRTVDQTFTISSGWYFVPTMATPTTGTVGKEESLYIMVRATIVKPADAHQVSERVRSTTIEPTSVPTTDNR